MGTSACPAAWLLKKIGKIGNSALKNRRKIGKSIVLLLTKIPSLHPIKVIIKATYKASASTLVGFRSTFAAKREWKWSVYGSLVYWLSYAVIRMIHVCLTTGQAWFCSQRWSYANSLQVSRKPLKGFEEWISYDRNFLRLSYKSLKNIELGLTSPMESFSSINLQLVAGWEDACLSQKTA